MTSLYHGLVPRHSCACTKNLVTFLAEVGKAWEQGYLYLAWNPGWETKMRKTWVWPHTVLLTSSLSVHACPLASDSKATRVPRPRNSRVNFRAHASAMCSTRGLSSCSWAALYLQRKLNLLCYSCSCIMWASDQLITRCSLDHTSFQTF